MINDSISRVVAFLDDDAPDLEVSFEGVYRSEAVYECRNKLAQSPEQTSGLPVYVLVTNRYTQRFASVEETEELMNDAAIDVVQFASESNGQDMVVDKASKTIIFPIKQNLSSKKGISAALATLRSLYEKRRKRYVLPAVYDGINLFDYNAEIVLVNTSRSVLQKEFDNMLIFANEVPIHVGEDCVVFPYFNRSLYAERIEFENTNNPDVPPENPLTLVYDDEVDFEVILSWVNRGRSSQNKY